MIRNREELNALRDKTFKSMDLRLDRIDDANRNEIHILVCGVAGCASSGSLRVAEEFEKQIKEKIRKICKKRVDKLSLVR